VERPLGKRSKLAWEMEGAAEMMVALHRREAVAEDVASWAMEGAAKMAALYSEEAAWKYEQASEMEGAAEMMVALHKMETSADIGVRFGDARRCRDSSTS
jgi:hypothetical protein